MTLLSVNLNKIALLRNSRGRDFPNVVDFAHKFYDLGVRGITIHPRQDERHITRQDALDLGHLATELPDLEFNVEGYPSMDFLALVDNIKPTQCTLVPDSPGQLTSDHGWDLTQAFDQVCGICTRLNNAGIRAALFLNPDLEQVRKAAATGANRIELYTQEFAETYHDAPNTSVFERYRSAAASARQLGLGLNAGHDLDLTNLAQFLKIDGILEVSIGHALTIECIEYGMSDVVKKYLAICASA